MKNRFHFNYRRAVLGMFCIVGTLSPVSDVFAEGSRHTETWNFGRFCRASWDENGAITATADPSIVTSEGSASFSNPVTGELILYSDGATVWDATGAVIGTGLPGHSSSIHSGVIVPHPQVPNRVFVVGHSFSSTSSVGYLEFDVSDPANIVTVGTNVVVDLDGGLATAREGMLVVPHANGIDYWVVVSGNSAVFVVPITNAGFGAVSKTVTNIPYSAWGVFAISNDGTSLVMSSTAREIFQLDFDPATGVIASTAGVADKTQWTVSPSVGFYGGAFSQDDSKFYYSNLGNNTIGSNLFQYDLGTDTETVLDTHPTRYLNSQTKLGPDGKMYVSTGISSVNAISSIDNANDAAASLTYTFGNVPMDAGCDPVLGLPQTISPEAIVALGVEVTGPTGTIVGNTTAPSGTANLPDGEVISVEVTTTGGFSATCMATVTAAKWACPDDSISGLPYDSNFTTTAQNGTTSGVNMFATSGCGDGVIGAGETCDDTNAMSGDGCTETCNVEPGYMCTAGVACEVVDNTADLDDDNDGILDSVECGSDWAVWGIYDDLAVPPNLPGTLGGVNLELTHSSDLRDPRASTVQTFIGHQGLNPAGSTFSDNPTVNIAESNGEVHTITFDAPLANDIFVHFTALDSSIEMTGASIVSLVNGTGLSTGVFTLVNDAAVVNEGGFSAIIPAGSTTFTFKKSTGGDNYMMSLTSRCVDTDSDLIPDFRDLDSDNDGITDAAEAFGRDTDGDGLLDGFNDGDGNGADDSTATIAPTDSNNDGRPDYQSLDADGDNLPDALEGHDVDRDGVADYSPAGADTDMDGIDDAFDPDCTAVLCAGVVGMPAGVPDVDADLIPDFQDVDSDADGITDDVECGAGQQCADSDLDNTPDYLETDSDGDTVTDAIEGHDVDQDGVADVVPSGADTDGDGLDDAFDADCVLAADCAGIIGVVATLPDTDTVGAPDFQDEDDDNDNLTTATEVADGLLYGDDPDNDGIPAYLDLDSDGDGASDLSEGGNDPATGMKWDVDMDGIPDYLDPDSAPTDTDGDGIPDSIECGGDVATCVDTDKDGKLDFEDIDDDNDGIPTQSEFTADDSDNQDQDNDGIPSHLDLDADGDGVLDIVEGHGPGAATVLSGDDTDNDGLDDAFDADDGGVPAGEPDTDMDGNPDYLDTDSDGDLVDDIVEGHSPGTTVSSGDDTDGDGIDDAFDTDDGGITAQTPDTDGDGTPDYRDTDDDGDGVPTADEDTDGDDDPTNDDTDGDGVPNYLDIDSDGDGILDSVEGLTDTDEDGTPDFLDTDSDNDGLTDLIEGHEGVVPTGTDSDNDGLDDAFDADNGGTPATLPDRDGDAIPNFLDADDDGDGIPTSLEDVDEDGNPANDDTDLDGIPNYLDLDSDGDGVTDTVECAGTAGACVDTDEDGTLDYLDLDSDGDSVPDVIEGHAAGVTPIGTDTDLDGIDDAFDPDNGGTVATRPDTDDDGTPNILDPDDDNDGVNTIDEDANNDGDLENDDSDSDGIPDYLDGSDDLNNSDILLGGGNVGGCSSTPSPANGLWLLVVGVIAGLRRRKRS